MTRWQASLGHDARVFVSALVGGLPGVVVSLALLWSGDHALKVRATLTMLVVVAWLAFAASVGEQVVRPLHAIANLLAALREGDFSIRARSLGAGEALGTVLEELNSMSAVLREQRLGAVEAHALLGTVMTEIDVAVFAFDGEHRLRLVNRSGERLLVAPQGRLLGQTAEALGMASFLAGEPARTLDVPFPGGRGPWEMRRASFRQRGMPHELVVLTDVKHALREEERQAWQRLSRVLGHEINNSLAPISSIAAELRAELGRETRRADWEADVTRGLGVIERRAGALARFMTAYAKLAKLPPPVLAAVDVEKWVRRVAALDNRAPVTVVSGPPLSVSGDSDQLDQLLINLVKNAIDAALETGGGVSVSWRRSRDCSEVVVTDEGPGIASASSLFVPFFTTKPEGSGIGLFLSRQIAEAHHGALELVDRGERRGCVAIVRLPLA
jgi:nitrogen fixation/metabolism regulation signal transduction histidine kinase